MKKKYLITSALPYINGVKHIGNLVGSMLPADVYAKFLKQRGHDVLFICGTDEHGTPAEIAAAEANIDIKSFCDNMYQKQKDIYERFSITFDYFGRSSSVSNKEITIEIYKALKQNGYIIEKKIIQYYSNADKRFLPDRYIEGTCYLCGYTEARGDQCDSCGSLMDPEKLLNPYSAISKSTDIVLQETNHLFLDLAKLQPTIQNWIDQTNFSDTAKGIAKKWLKEGLNARCITRDLSWGISVPELGYQNKVFYVWFDAPNAYISITKDFLPEKWCDWWIEDRNNPDNKIEYVQFMAKDNVAFHSIFWPGVLFASTLGYRQVDYIKAFSWLTYNKGKFSTSKKRGIFTDTALELFPVDYWRYYLIANCPENNDSDFSLNHFADIINKDLCNVLGNFCNRTLAMIQKHSTRVIDTSYININDHLMKEVSELIHEFEENLYTMNFRAAMQSLRSLWVLGNAYITDKEPWNVIKNDKAEALSILYNCLHLIRIFAIVSYPIIPNTSKKICAMLNIPDDMQIIDKEELLNFKYFQNNHKINDIAKLFDKIEDEYIEKLHLSKRF